MIELKHYIAHWLVRNIEGDNDGYAPYIKMENERFLSREEAESVVQQKRAELENCELANMEWFKEYYLSDIDNKFFVEECDKIY